MHYLLLYACVCSLPHCAASCAVGAAAARAGKPCRAPATTNRREQTSPNPTELRAARRTPRVEAVCVLLPAAAASTPNASPRPTLGSAAKTTAAAVPPANAALALRVMLSCGPKATSIDERVQLNAATRAAVAHAELADRAAKSLANFRMPPIPCPLMCESTDMKAPRAAPIKDACIVALAASAMVPFLWSSGESTRRAVVCIASH